MPLIWLATVAFVYLALGHWLYLIADAIQRRRYGGLVSLAGAAVLWAGLVRFVPAPTEWALVAASAAAVVWLKVHQRASFAGATWVDAKRRHDLARQVKLHLALATGALVFLVPFAWLVSTSIKPEAEINRYPPEFVPRRAVTVRVDGQARGLAVLRPSGWKVALVAQPLPGKQKVEVVAPRNQAGRVLYVPQSELSEVRKPTMLWRNYADSLRFLPPEYNKGLVPLWNTVYVTLLSILGTVLTSSLVAYSFARLRWPGRDVLFVVMLATMMIPGAVTMLPVFLIFRWLGWVDSLRPLYVGSFFGGAFYVFLLRQFFMTIPLDLEDAAKIDGCSFFGTYWRIMLPLIKPALAAVTIMTFMSAWSSFMGPLIYISSPEKVTVAYALQLFQGGPHGGERSMMMAASTLVMLPVLAIFFFTQRYFIQGVTLTGMKA